MYPICTLVKGVLPLNIVKYFPNAYTVTSSYNCSFIKLVFVFSSRLL